MGRGAAVGLYYAWALFPCPLIGFVLALVAARHGLAAGIATLVAAPAALAGAGGAAGAIPRKHVILGIGGAVVAAVALAALAAYALSG